MRSASQPNELSKIPKKNQIEIKSIQDIVQSLINRCLIIIQIKQWQNTLFKLDLNIKEDRAKYKDIRFAHTVYSEGLRHEVYDDQNPQWKPNTNAPLKGKRTIGIGFNMDRHDAREEWDNAFVDLVSKPLFDEVLQGKNLTEEEVQILFDYSLTNREKQFESMYQGILESLRPNERLSLESIYYNGPSWVKPEGNPRIKPQEENIFPTLQRFVKTQDPQILNSIKKKIKENCNPFNPDEDPLIYRVIKWRRYREAKLFGNRFKLETQLSS